MKYGIVLPTYIPSEERRVIAERSYKSLNNSELPEDVPFYVVAAGMPALSLVADSLKAKIFTQPPEVAGLDPSLAWIVDVFFKETDCTHIIELADDMIYHPQWFAELKALVERHPDARAWSVYRSAHTRHHRTLQQVNGDHLVTSMAGNGTCWTREEWVAWGVNWKQGPRSPVPSGGDTLDLHHAYYRPGERWATDKSFLQHIGVVGAHCQVGVPEFALNYVGEGE